MHHYSVGVNNILQMHSSDRFTSELESLLEAIDRKTNRHSAVMVMGLPPMSMFVALPPLLQSVAVGAEVQVDCICTVYLCVPVCVIEGGGAS